MISQNKVYSAASMKRIDHYAINTLGIPSLTLMETAAKAVVRAAEEEFGSLKGQKCAVFCSMGNNGGDGMAIARLLLDLGAQVLCLSMGDRAKITPDRAEMELRLLDVGGTVTEYRAEEDISAQIKSCDFIFDAMLGIGFHGALRSPLLQAAMDISDSQAKVIAVDIPTGVNSDTGHCSEYAVKADLTVTFTAPKAGLLLTPGCFNTGKLKIVDIGIPQEALDTETALCQVVDEALVGSSIPARCQDTHKGDYGKILMLCGSVGFTGAAVMASKAALRSGAGLVYVGVPEKVYPIVAAQSQEAMVFPLPCDEKGRLTLDALPEILERLNKCDACLLGPGLGRSKELDRLVAEIICTSAKPLVIDADGINALAENIDILSHAKGDIVLTPHDGELKRLGGSTDDRLSSARSFASEHNCTLVMKGHRTITAGAEGAPLLNTTGNAGMATGGSGDVLAGIIASFIGQGLRLPGTGSAAGAAALAVWVHGRAGDLCAQELGQHGMLPTDMIEALPRVIKAVAE